MQLLRKLDALIDEFARGRTWGTVEIQFSEGVPVLFRKALTEKLTQDKNRADEFRR